MITFFQNGRTKTGSFDDAFGSTYANHVGELISAVGGIFPSVTIFVAAPMSGRP